jgi:hypothetical protein
MLEMTARQLRQDVLDTATDRFERRLSEESAALRLEMAALRLDMAEVRLDIARSRNSTNKWMFAYWLTAMLAIVLKH